MKVEEIIQKLNDSELDTSELLELLEGPEDETFGNVAIVDEVGGHEGGGDYAMRVVHFKDHNVFLKLTGSYSSYEGTDWDSDWKEVVPKEKMITVYE